MHWGETVPYKQPSTTLALHILRIPYSGGCDHVITGSGYPLPITVIITRYTQRFQLQYDMIWYDILTLHSLLNVAHCIILGIFEAIFATWNGTKIYIFIYLFI